MPNPSVSVIVRLLMVDSCVMTPVLCQIYSIIGWQWANQTLNVAVNFSNANKSIKMSNQEILTGKLI